MRKVLIIAFGASLMTFGAWSVAGAKDDIVTVLCGKTYQKCNIKCGADDKCSSGCDAALNACINAGAKIDIRGTIKVAWLAIPRAFLLPRVQRTEWS